jgi:hypothetical protein
MRGRLLVLGLVAGCSREAPRGGEVGGASSALSASAAAPAAASASGSGSGVTAVVAPLGSVVPRCCRIDRTEGMFGPEKGVHVRYSGDVLLRNDGERLLFPHDLVSDTKELYQFAKSSGKSLYQERRLRVVGEGVGYVALEVQDRGETGAGTPFFHTHCATVDTRKLRKMTPEEAFPGEAGQKLLAEARRRFEEAPGHERFRFVPASFALLEGRVRFCCPPRDDRQPLPRLDLELETGTEPRKLVLQWRPR